jgi:transcriptional regulator with XRE-family HTH domain
LGTIIKVPTIIEVLEHAPSAVILLLEKVLVNRKRYSFAYFGTINKRKGDNMANLYERLHSLCKEKGIAGGRMCTDLGFSKSLMTDLKSGRKKGVNADTAQKLAMYFGVTVGYLLGEEEDKKRQPTEIDGLSDKRKALMQFAMSVPEDKAEMILRVMQTILKDD